MDIPAIFTVYFLLPPHYQNLTIATYVNWVRIVLVSDLTKKGLPTLAVKVGNWSSS